MEKNTSISFNAPELQGVEQSKAEQIRNTFEPMAAMLSEFEDQYNEVVSQSEKEITSELTKKAKSLRIAIGKVRIETEKVRKEQKEEYLRAGKAIDGVSNILKWAVSDKEGKLKEIENYFELQEQKRLEELQEKRASELSKYVEDASERDLSGMDEDVWTAYFESKKKEHEDRLAAEKKAEQERIAKEKAEAEERARIQKENEELKKQAEKQEAERRKAEEEREAKEAEMEAKLKAEREEKERIEKEEREKREKLEAELLRKEQEAEAAKKAEEDRVQSELNKGDSAKVEDLLSDLEQLKTKYSFKSKKNQKMYSDVGILLGKVMDHIKK